MRITAIILALSLSISSISYASTSTPSRCPDISAIQAADLNYTHESDGYYWVTAYMPSNKYGTDQDWNFILSGGNISTANSADQALERARKVLQKLGPAIGGPHSDDNKIWQCRYRSSFVVMALAFTPPVDPDGF